MLRGTHTALLAPTIVLITSVYSSTHGSRPIETCPELFDGLRSKVEANYAGYRLEVVGERLADHTRLVASLGSRAAEPDLDDPACLVVLKSYVDWFDDPHLFLYQSTNLSEEETERRRSSIPRLDVEKATVLADLASRSNVDPIEGIWSDLGMRMAVVPDPDAGAGQFVAVVTVSDDANLPVGTIRARFARADDGAYTVSYHWRSLARTELTGTIHRGSILRISPAMWGKVAPLPPAMSGLLDSIDVRRPTLTVRGDMTIVSVPSHDPRLRSVLDSLIEANRAKLGRSRKLVVDLRGNEGGGSQTTNSLLPFLMDASPSPRSLDPGEAVMLSSTDQIQYASRSFGNPESAFVRRLVGALEAAPGELVPLLDPDEVPAVRPEVTPDYGPPRAALLIDGGTVSAAEVLVLEVQRSRRTIVIGAATAGALDYQSTAIVRIAEGEDRWFLGYPTITAHARLPEGGMRGIGISPDVEVDWVEIEDPFKFTEEVLERAPTKRPSKRPASALGPDPAP